MNLVNKRKYVQKLLCVCLAMFITISISAGVLAYATEGTVEDAVIIPGGTDSEAVVEDRLVILLDTSGSMKGMEEFVRQALLNAFDLEYGSQQNEKTLLTTLILFNERCYVFGEVDLGTAEGRAQYKANLQSAVDNNIKDYTCWYGRTMIGVALEQAYKRLENNKGQGTILLFSDGGIYNKDAAKVYADEQLSFRIASACEERDIPIFTCGLDKGAAETRFETKCNGAISTQREFLGALSGTAQIEYTDNGKIIGEASGSYNSYRITVENDAVTGEAVYGVSHSTESSSKAEGIRSVLTPDLEGVAAFFSAMLDEFEMDISSEVIYAEDGTVTPYKFEVVGSDAFLSAIDITLSCSTANLGTADSRADITVISVKQPDGGDITDSAVFSSPNANTLRISITKLSEDGVYTLDINNKSGKSVLLSISTVFKYDFSMEASLDAGKAFGDTAVVKAALINGNGDSKQQIISKSVLESCRVTLDKCYYSKNSQSTPARLNDIEGTSLSVDSLEGLFTLSLNSVLGGSLTPGEYKLNLRCEYHQEDSDTPIVRTATVFFNAPAPYVEVKATSNRLLFGHGTDITLSIYKDASKTETASLPQNAKVYYRIDDGENTVIPVEQFKSGKYVLKTEKFASPKTVSVVFTVALDDPSQTFADAFKVQASETIVVSGPVFGVKRADNSPVYFNTPLKLSLGAYTTSAMDEPISADVPISGSCRLVISQGDKVIAQDTIQAEDIKSKEGNYIYTYKDGFKGTGVYTVSVYTSEGTEADTAFNVTVVPYVLTPSSANKMIKHTMDEGDVFESQPVLLDELFVLTDASNSAVDGISVSDYIAEYSASLGDADSLENGTVTAELTDRTLSFKTTSFGEWTVTVSYTTVDGQNGSCGLLLKVDMTNNTLRNILIILGATLLVAAAVTAFVLLHKTPVPSNIRFKIVADGKDYPMFNVRTHFSNSKLSLYDILVDYPFPVPDDNAKARLRTLANELTDQSGNKAQKIIFKGKFTNKVYVINDGKATAYTIKQQRFQNNEVKHSFIINGHRIELGMSKN